MNLCCSRSEVLSDFSKLAPALIRTGFVVKTIVNWIRAVSTAFADNMPNSASAVTTITAHGLFKHIVRSVIGR